MNDNLELKIDRIRLGLKAIDVAKKLGVSNGQFSKIENGHIAAPTELLEKLRIILEEN